MTERVEVSNVADKGDLGCLNYMQAAAVCSAVLGVAGAYFCNTLDILIGLTR